MKQRVKDLLGDRLIDLMALAGQAQWIWIGLGLLLVMAELVVPGFFMIRLAGAAILTGLAVWTMPMGIKAQVGVFAVLAFVLVALNRFEKTGRRSRADRARSAR